jgi:hypothetical protein
MKKSCPIKRYVVNLTPEEREKCETIISKGKTCASIVTRARILLMSDVSDAGLGWTDEKIVEALGVGDTTVQKARKRLVLEGLDSVITHKKSSNLSALKIFDGADEARLIAVACSAAPEGYARWTIRLLEDRIVELGLPKASDTTIQRTLKKTNFSPTSTNTG